MKTIKVLFLPLLLFVQNSLAFVGPDLHAIGDGEQIPADLLATHNSRELGEAVVNRIKETEYREALILEKSDRNENVQMRLYFPHKRLDAILENGFYNLHQTGFSGGIANKKKRLNLEETVTRLKFDTDSSKTKELLPKYAYLVEKSNPRQLINTRYGLLAAVFKENVKARSTWTADDSLDNLHFGMRAKSFSSLSRTDNVHTNSFVMPEAQIFGALDLSDVEYFLLPRNALTENPALIEQIQAMGIAIHLYDFQEQAGVFGQYILEDHQAYDPGDPAKRQAAQAQFLAKKQSSDPHYQLNDDQELQDSDHPTRAYPLVQDSTALIQSRLHLPYIAHELSCDMNQLAGFITLSEPWKKSMEQILQNMVTREVNRLDEQGVGREKIQEILSEKNIEKVVQEDTPFGFEWRHLQQEKLWYNDNESMREAYGRFLLSTEAKKLFELSKNRHRCPPPKITKSSYENGVYSCSFETIIEVDAAQN